MKNLLLKQSILVALIAILNACGSHDLLIPQDRIGIETADRKTSKYFNDNVRRVGTSGNENPLSIENKSPIDLNQFLKSDVKKIYSVQSNTYLFSAISSLDKEISLTMAMNETTGELINIFITQSHFEDNKGIGHVYSIEGLRLLSFEMLEDGSRSILYQQSIEESGIDTPLNGWWSRFDKCAGELNGPTDSNVANILFGTIANAATLGLYTPLSLVVCAGVASGSKDE